MKRRTTTSLALLAGASLAIGPMLGAAASGNTPIVNGDFEADAIGATTITGWTAMNQLIDLGVTSIAGCLTVDTSDYTQLRDYYDEAEVDWNRFGQAIDGQDYLYYVTTRGGDPITVLGYPLVFDDWEWAYALEVPVLEPLSVSEEDVEVLIPGEPIDDSGATSDPGTEEPSEEQASPQETSPAEQPSPAIPAEEVPTPFTPANGSSNVDYILQWHWTSEQQEAFEEVERANMPDPSVRQDNISSIPNFLEEGAEYATRIVDLADIERYDDDLGEYVSFGSGKAVELYSDMWNDEGYDGYVAHGPAIFSDPFTVSGARQISLDWAALDESDDFKVFGYLLNTATCKQTEVIDATGQFQDWTTTTVNIPTAGTYRFVFVSGTFDQSFGGAAGAYMYVDNIVQKPAFSSPGVSIGLAAKVGDYLPGSEVEIAGGGLLGDSDYDLVLRSTPVLIAEGVADAQGSFFEIVTLPQSITPGAHTITLTGIAPNGEPMTAVVYITVGADGTLLYVSTEGPEEVSTGPGAPELAMTGANVSAIAGFAGVLLLAGAATLVTLRRRPSAS